jgi:hypothetical protein
MFGTGNVEFETRSYIPAITIIVVVVLLVTLVVLA